MYLYWGPETINTKVLIERNLLILFCCWLCVSWDFFDCLFYLFLPSGLFGLFSLNQRIPSTVVCRAGLEVVNSFRLPFWVEEWKTGFHSLALDSLELTELCLASPACLAPLLSFFFIMKIFFHPSLLIGSFMGTIVWFSGCVFIALNTYFHALLFSSFCWIVCS